MKRRAGGDGCGDGCGGVGCGVWADSELTAERGDEGSLLVEQYLYGGLHGGEPERGRGVGCEWRSDGDDGTGQAEVGVLVVPLGECFKSGGTGMQVQLRGRDWAGGVRAIEACITGTRQQECGEQVGWGIGG